MKDSGIGKAGGRVKVKKIVTVGGILEVGRMWRPDTLVGTRLEEKSSAIMTRRKIAE
jgi:hypothetical protein